MKAGYSEKRKTTLICLTAAALCAAVFSLINAVMFASNYDAEKQLAEKAFTRASYIIAFASVIVCFVSARVLPIKKKADALKSSSRGIPLVSALCGFFLVATVIMQIIMMLNHSLQSDAGKYQGKLHYLALVLAIPAAFYFLYSIFAEKESRKVKAVLGITLMLWCMACIIVTYLYIEIPINSPERVLSIISFIALMLFFTEEIRYFLGKPLPRLYCALALCAFVVSVGNSLPLIILSVAKINSFKMSISTIYNFFELSAGTYALLRVVSLVKRKIKAPQVSETEEN